MKINNRYVRAFFAVSSVLSVGALIFSACSHSPVQSERRPASSDDFDLYKNEAWEGGSRDAEVAIFNRQSADVLTAQTNLQKKGKSAQPDRVFHKKQHGCLVGSLEVRSNDSEQFASSMFSGKKKSYTVLARFSNGVGLSQHDLMPDVRGIGIKIFGVHDNQDGTDKTVDINMTNSPVPFGDDTQDFIDFMKSQDDPGVSQVSYFTSHPRVAVALLKATLKYTSSLTQTQFWSGHPYLDTDTAMKLNIRPEATEAPVSDDISSHYPANLDDISLKGMIHELGKLEGFFNSMAVGDLQEDWDGKRNYLHDDLVKRLQQGPVRYVMSVQLERDPVTTPIEKNLTEWKESNSRSIPVADLVFDQQTMDDPALDQLCQQARFTPGHYVSQHRPLSNMGRGRIFAYRASQNGRGASQTEVSEDKVLEIRKRIAGH